MWAILEKGRKSSFLAPRQDHGKRALGFTGQCATSVRAPMEVRSILSASERVPQGNFFILFTKAPALTRYSVHENASMNSPGTFDHWMD